MRIGPENPFVRDVLRLLDEQRSEMLGHSPPESVHALDPGGAADPSLILFVARAEDGTLLGVGGLKDLGRGHGELKAMRTTVSARGRGVGRALLEAIIDAAEERGMTRLSLETGASEPFAPALRLYRRHGFEPCGPFADYAEDPHSVFLSRSLPVGTPVPDGSGRGTR